MSFRTPALCAFGILMGLGFLGAISARAHDLAHMSSALIDAEAELAKGQIARDEIATSAPDLANAVFSYYSQTYKWDHTNFTVCFWQTNLSDAALIAEIVRIANLWTARGSVSFEFGPVGAPRTCHDKGSADLRVTLDQLPPSFYGREDDPGWDWARYGILARRASPLVSMSLVHARLYNSQNRDAELHFVVAHEFGHALGLIHEHQLMDCASLLADDATVKLVLGLKNDKDLDLFKTQLTKITPDTAPLNGKVVGGFESTSIMMYNFPQQIWKKFPPGANNPCARKDVEVPSPNDLDGVAAMYPSRAIGSVAAARTNAAGNTPALATADSAERDRAFGALRAQAVLRAKLLQNGLDLVLKSEQKTVQMSKSLGLRSLSLPSRAGDIEKQVAPSLKDAQRAVSAIDRMGAALARAQALASE